MLPDLLDEEMGDSGCGDGNKGMKWVIFVMELTTTIIASCLDDSGSSTMKSTLTVSHRVSGIGNRQSSPAGSRLWAFFQMHRSSV